MKTLLKIIGAIVSMFTLISVIAIIILVTQIRDESTYFAGHKPSIEIGDVLLANEGWDDENPFHHTDTIVVLNIQDGFILVMDQNGTKHSRNFETFIYNVKKYKK